MKTKLLLICGLFVLAGCGEKNQPAAGSSLPPYQKPDLSNCTPNYELTIKYDQSNLEHIGAIAYFSTQVGYYPGETFFEFPVKGNKIGSFKEAERGQKIYVRAIAYGLNGRAYSQESVLEVLTCEELKKKVEAGELVVDTHEVTLKF